jgi:hypothetical protein
MGRTRKQTSVCFFVGLTGVSHRFVYSKNDKYIINYIGTIMASDPFNSVGGFTVNIPPISVIDANGNITSNLANISLINSNTISVTGDVTANAFYGNLVGNIVANIVVPGTNTSVVFNDQGLANANSDFTFDKVSSTVTVTGNLVANTVTVGVGNLQYSTSKVIFATTTSTGANQVLHRVLATTVSSVDYTVIATDSTANTRQTSKLIAAVLGTDVGYYEYGTILMNGGVGDFRVEYNSGNVELQVTPDTSNLTDYKIMITQYKE